MPDPVQKVDDRELELESTIGFNGSFPGSLLVHPDGQHYIFSLGSTVVIRDKSNPRNQYFLQGHTNSISCLVASKSGRYLASGQVTHQGFQADVIIWDYATKSLLHRLTLHKVKVEALAFSPSETYLASLGGEDDCTVVVWDVQRGKAVCACPASKDSDGVARCVEYSANDDCTFVTGGNHTLRVWNLDPHSRTVRAQDCQTGILKRVVVKVIADENDEYIYCGTTTGDILQVNLKTRMFKMAGPQKDKVRWSNVGEF